MRRETIEGEGLINQARRYYFSVISSGYSGESKGNVNFLPDYTQRMADPKRFEVFLGKRKQPPV
jgi:hypothetical protein